MREDNGIRDCVVGVCAVRICELQALQSLTTGKKEIYEYTFRFVEIDATAFCEQAEVKGLYPTAIDPLKGVLNR